MVVNASDEESALNQAVQQVAQKEGIDASRLLAFAGQT